MAYKIYFIANNRVMFIKIWGNHTPEDATRISDEFTAFLDSRDHPVYCLGDFSKLKSIGTNLPAFRNASSFYGHPRLAFSIGYGKRETVILGFLANMLAAFFKAPIRMASTKEDAIKFLATRDPELGEILTSEIQKLEASEAAV